MTTYELQKESEAFRLGYWDAIKGTDNFPANPKPSERIDYRRGQRIGIAEYRSGR